jgi:hypothetical protein
MKRQGDFLEPTIGVLAKRVAYLCSRASCRRRTVGPHSNVWGDRVSQYLKGCFGNAHEVRFSDFSGMTFYGDGSERSKMSISLDGRSRRLHEFMSELGV